MKHLDGMSLTNLESWHGQLEIQMLYIQARFPGLPHQMVTELMVLTELMMQRYSQISG